MKTIAQPDVFTPSIFILALLAAGIIFVGLTGKNIPLLSNIRLHAFLKVHK
jgi:hypothetical protein